MAEIALEQQFKNWELSKEGALVFDQAKPATKDWGPRRRLVFGVGRCSSTLKGWAMQAGRKAAAARRRSKPILEFICVYTTGDVPTPSP